MITVLNFVLKNIRAYSLLSLNNLEEGFNLANNCYEEANNFFKEEEQDIKAEIKMIIGIYHYKINQFENAENFLKESVKIFDEFLEEAVLIDQANPHRHLGDLYSSQGKMSEAKEQYQIALSIYEKLLYKDQIPDFHETSRKLASINA